MGKLKFYNKLSFRIALTVLIPVISISIIGSIMTYHNIYELTEQKHTDNLELINLSYVNFIDQKLTQIEAQIAARTIILENRNIHEKQKLLTITKSLLSFDSLIYGCGIAFEENKYNSNEDAAFFYSYMYQNEIKQIAFCDNENPKYFDYLASQPDWWRIPLKTYDEGWTSPYYDSDAGKTKMLTYFHPFFSKGVFYGIITLDISLDRLYKLIHQQEKSFNHSLPVNMYIIDKDSTILYSENKAFIGKNVYLLHKKVKYSYKERIEIINQAFKGKYGKTYLSNTDNNETNLVFYSKLMSSGWLIISIIPYENIKFLVFNKMRNTIIFIIVFVLLLILLIIFSAQFLSGPIIDLSKVSLHIADGKYGTSLEVKSKTEIGILASNFSIMRDKLRIREMELKKANIQLKKLDKAKNDFLQLISHEIRTPLNGIVGLSCLIDESIEDPEVKEYIKILTNSADRLESFSLRALNITDLQTIGKQLSLKPIAVNSVIRDILEKFNNEAHKKNISITTELIENDKEAMGLKNYFHSVIEVLVDNAVKYSTENSNIIIKTYIEKEEFFVDVINTGDVIPLCKTEQITKAFSLGEEHIDNNIGLGLYYVKLYIDTIKASMKIDSNKEKTLIKLCFEIA